MTRAAKAIWVLVCACFWGCSTRPANQSLPQPKPAHAKAILEVPPLPPVISAVVAPTNTVTLAWNPSAGVVAGYNIYVGHASRSYFSMIDVGNVTNAAFSIGRSQTNYFTATSYDANGVESDYANEVVLTPVVQAPSYGLIFLQASTNGADFYDLSPTPYLRLTNAAGALPWQWFRSRTERTTNWR
jgi:hypothetical protein